MRNFALAVLLAIGVSAPAVAQEETKQSRENVQIADRGERGGGRGGGFAGVGRWGGQSRQAPPQAAPQAQPQAMPQPQRNFDGGGRRWNGGGGDFRRDAPQAVPQAAPQAAPQARDWNRGSRAGNRNWEGRRNWEGQSRGNDDGNRQFRRRGGDLNSSPPQGVPQQAVPQTREWNRGDRDGNRNWGDRNRDGNRDGVRNQNDGNRNWSDRNRDGNRNWSDRNRGNDSWRHSRGNDHRRYSDRDRRHHGYSNGHRWNHDWRRDNRYDWQGYRNSNRGYYRQPRYYNPYGYGYGYNRFSIGIYLDSLFYSDRYWINDPYSYRLPQADGPYRWVRYYNDALLVDIYSGEVVDAIYGFFW